MPKALVNTGFQPFVYFGLRSQGLWVRSPPSAPKCIFPELVFPPNCQGSGRLSPGGGGLLVTPTETRQPPRPRLAISSTRTRRRRMASGRRKVRPFLPLAPALSLALFQQLYQGMQDAVDRGRDTQRFAAAQHVAVEVVDLAGLAARHVMGGGRQL